MQIRSRQSCFTNAPFWPEDGGIKEMWGFCITSKIRSPECCWAFCGGNLLFLQQRLCNARRRIQEQRSIRGPCQCSRNTAKITAGTKSSFTFSEKRMGPIHWRGRGSAQNTCVSIIRIGFILIIQCFAWLTPRNCDNFGVRARRWPSLLMCSKTPFVLHDKRIGSQLALFRICLYKKGSKASFHPSLFFPDAFIYTMCSFPAAVSYDRSLEQKHPSIILLSEAQPCIRNKQKTETGDFHPRQSSPCVQSWFLLGFDIP